MLPADCNELPLSPLEHDPMTYIPIVPVTPASPPSPEAQDLGLKIAELARLMRQENPNIGAADIRQGLQLAAQNLRPEIGGPRVAIVLLTFAAVVGMTILGLFLAKGGMDRPWSIAPVTFWIIGGIAAAVCVLLAIKLKRS